MTKQEVNTNCLEGIRCPKCGSYEPFYIVCTGTEKVYDMGTEDSYDSEWDDDSNIICAECDHEGTVALFSIQTDGSLLTLVLNEEELPSLRRVIETPDQATELDYQTAYDRLSAALADREVGDIA